MSNNNRLKTEHTKGNPNKDIKNLREDTWDLSEFEELVEAPQKSVSTNTEDNSLLGRTHTTEEGSRMAFDVDLGAVKSTSYAEGVDNPSEQGGAGVKRRRSFCNFHYRTTQGGSASTEPGDDSSMQSPPTSTKPLKLVEFPHNTEASQED